MTLPIASLANHMQITLTRFGLRLDELSSVSAVLMVVIGLLSSWAADLRNWESTPEVHEGVVDATKDVVNGDGFSVEASIMALKCPKAY